MQILEDTWKKKGDIHHAYVVGHISKEEYLELSDFLKELFSDKRPDIRSLDYDVFGIGEARQLRADQSLSSVDSKQVFIIKSNTITVEAQNALLKVLEEPAHDTHFFLCIDERLLIPTLRSRVISIQRKGSTPIDGLIETFLQKDFTEQLLFVRTIAEKYADTKDKKEAENFLNSLEKELCSNVFENSRALKAIQTTKKYLSLRGANVKLLLENLVLSL